MDSINFGIVLENMYEVFEVSEILEVSESVGKAVGKAVVSARTNLLLFCLSWPIYKIYKNWTDRKTKATQRSIQTQSNRIVENKRLKRIDNDINSAAMSNYGYNNTSQILHYVCTKYKENHQDILDYYHQV